MEEKKILKKVNIVISICSVVIIACLVAIGFIYVNNRYNNRFDYKNHLNETVLTIDDYTYNLREVAYYVIKMEASVDNTANAYNPKNPKEYWNLYINNKFVSGVAHDNCMNLVIRDYMYANEAKKLGLTVSDEKISEINDEVHNTLKSLSGPQMDITNYSEKELYDILYRVALAESYVTYITEKDSSLTEENLNIDGDYFKNLKKDYNIIISKKLWDKVNVGFVTINND